MKKIIWLLSIFALVIFNSEGASALREFQEGMELPSFTISDIAGKSLPIREVAGNKGTLLVFWQSTTKNSEKALLQFQARYADWQQKGLQVLAINVEEQNISAADLQMIKTFADKLPFPVFVDRGLVVFDKLGVIALPSMILIDDKMLIQKEMSGFPLVGAQLFFEEVGYFLGEKREVAKEVYKPVKQALLTYQMGLRQEKQKNFDRAIETYERAASLDPAYVGPVVRLVELYLQNQRLDAAKTVLNKIDKNIADNPVVMMTLAKVYYHEKDSAKAKELLAKSLAREETPDAYVYSGFILYGEGKSQEAENSFTQAVTLSKNAPDIFYKIGRFFAARNEHAQANAYYKSALEQIFLTGTK
jgi:uncharacterized protein HemY/peroxiredoxin